MPDMYVPSFKLIPVTQPAPALEPIDVGEVPPIVAQVFSLGTPEMHAQLWEIHLRAHGSREAVIEWLEEEKRTMDTASYVGFHFTQPPVLRRGDLKSFALGPLEIYFHSTHPFDKYPHHELMWVFYISEKGAGPDGVLGIERWYERGVTVYLEDFKGHWNRIGLLVAQPLARVAVKLPLDLVEGARLVEHILVFPPDPRKKPGVQVHSMVF